MRVTVIGSWSAQLDGQTIQGGNQKAILHALIVAGRAGRSLSYEDLVTVLPNPRHGTRKERGSLIRMTVKALRNKGVEIELDEGRYELAKKQPSLSVDLWDFFAYVREGDYDDAAAMVEPQDELWVPADEGLEHLWEEAQEDFRTARDKVLDYARRRRAGVQTMLEQREDLLKRPLSHGFEPRTAIRDLRDRLRWFWFPWHDRRAASPSGEGPLPEHLSALLSESSAAPSRIVLIGSPGFGKALTAATVYLLLTDSLEATPPVAPSRSVLFLDARREGKDQGFGEDDWFVQRLADAGFPAHERPIVILIHADAYFSAQADADRLADVLAHKVFRECDLLLTCNEQFHLKILGYEDYGTNEIQLDSWDEKTQGRYVEALYDEETRASFERWRDADSSRSTRSRLCEEPLQLTYVLSLFKKNKQALAEIEQRWQLYDRVARTRLAATHHQLEQDVLLDDLAALAHEFYAAGSPIDPPIRFSESLLRANLERRGVEGVDRRSKALMEHTVLTVDGVGNAGFQDLPWGWFFTACFLRRTLTKQLPSADVLGAFDKLFSVAVMDRCEEVLLESPERQRLIVPALRSALESTHGSTFVPVRHRVAREQVGYLLGVLADVDTRPELESMLQPGDSWEGDDLVRRGIAVGLANGGAVHVADWYVETLREELRGGETTQADTNIGVVLSFRGDQTFDPADPGAIAPHPDPARTIRDLINGLGRSRHEGTWRIKLFTLFDLADRVAPDRFPQLVDSYRDQLCEVLDRLDQKAKIVRWPEIDEMRNVLDGLPAPQP